MFELTITNNKKSGFVIQPNKRYGFNSAFHDRIEFENDFLSISGLSHKSKQNDHYENEQYLILICGLVYNRLHNSNDLNPIDAIYVLNKYSEEGNSCLEKMKGNFILFIYNKLTNTFILAKDQLGLKYLYYQSKGSSFYISTNLSDFKRLSHSINESAIFEKLLFTYPIADESYIEDVFLLPQGNYITNNSSGLSIIEYYNIENLFPSAPSLKQFDEEYFLQLFEKSVLQRASAENKVNVALTGGFDGRSIVSVLLKNKREIRTYSFGKSGGENTKVPLSLAEKLGLDYFPIFLDVEFEKQYNKCASDAVYYSDGISIFERANYIFAIEKLTLYSKYNITGLIGGEVLAPVHQQTDYINETYYNLVYNEANFSIEDTLVNNGLSKYINLNTISIDTEDKLKRNIQIRKNQINLWKKHKCDWMYYLKDLVSLGFQRFYGNQMHLERYFNENLTPFYDLDLLDYIFSSNYIYVYKKAFQSSPFVRRNNRKLQSLIISNYYHSLGELPVDRGYPPNYNLDIRKYLIPFHFYKRKRLAKFTLPDFISPIWNEKYFSSIELDISNEEDLFNLKEISYSLINYTPEKHNKSFNHMLSLLVWLKPNL